MGLWREVRGVEETEAGLLRDVRRQEELESGLARCGVCGGYARIEVFGLFGEGVWVGCDASPECARHIEYHSEGWSMEEAAGEWNRYNSGLYKYLRRMKDWYRARFGRVRKAEREMERAMELEKSAVERKKREVFGVGEVRKPRKWWQKMRRGGGKTV